MPDCIGRKEFLTTLGVLGAAGLMGLIVTKSGERYDKTIKDDVAEVAYIMGKSDSQLAIAYSYLEREDEGNYLFFLGNARDNLRRDLNEYNVKAKESEIYNGGTIKRRLGALNYALESGDKLPDLEQIVGEDKFRDIQEMARSDEIQNIISKEIP